MPRALTLVPASPRPALAGDNYTPDQVLGFHITANGGHLPVLTILCSLCGQRAPINGHDTTVLRIDSDSSNGYGTHHRSCLAAEQAAWEALNRAR